MGWETYILGMSDKAQQAVLDPPAPPALETKQASKPAETRKKPKPLPPFKVLLHNDDVNSFDHVIASILKLTTLTPPEAILRTLEAHETGVALLLMTHRERAELYVDQFASLKLNATAEPAE
jgi:ATP-dependent Clp protease adaptor protein ClpS